MTRFEDLEEMQTEVRLKQNLWNAQGEWEVLQEKWSTVSLRTHGRDVHVGVAKAGGCACIHT